MMKQNKHEWQVVLKALLFIGVLFFYGCDSSDDPNPGVVVDAGADQTIGLGETVNLLGTATGGSTLVYVWEITTRPLGSTVLITNFFSAATSFVPDAVGVYELKLTVTNEDGDEGTDELVITVEEGEGPTEIGGTIDADMTLVNRFEDPLLPDYIASSRVTVNATLTIEPGVRIVFEDDRGMSINSGGALVAVGNSTENIIFTGVQKEVGYWKGLSIESNDAKNELTYSVIEYGGSSGFDGANLKANLMVEGSGKIKITNSTFRNGAGYGLYTRSLESDLPGFSTNTFIANDAPIMTRINHYQYFDSNSDYSGNNKDYIDSYWSNNNTEKDVTWQALNVPYRMADNIEKIVSDITIVPGAEFLGQPNGGIMVSTGGSLKAVGTGSSIISFKGEQDVRGYWRGITFESNTTDNELTFVSISNGGEAGFDGANLKANIMVEGSGRLKITNTTSTKSGGYGLYTRSLDTTLPDFADNTFTDNVAPVMTRLNHYQYFDSNSDYSGNDKNYIDSYWSNNDVTVDATWNALNVPYRMANNIEDIDAAVTVQEGANFIGQPDGGIAVKTNGSLKAIGSSSNKISFKGEQDVVGYWRGLRFLSNNANNVFENVIISNGGTQGFDGGNRKANIEVGNGAIFTITDSELTKSGGHAIRVQSGGNLTQSGLTFGGNLSTDIQID
ncbi:MAG TPA: hypothetical protein PKL31_15645 [Fulvivirga sp.]|nr:hypothetical protein [Fulvivirga sp.]